MTWLEELYESMVRLYEVMILVAFVGIAVGLVMFCICSMKGII